MKTPRRFSPSIAVVGLLVLAGWPARAADSPPATTAASSAPPAATRPTKDANGNALRYAPTGHVSNYDEAKVGTYTLPDPLRLLNGEPVRDADTWFKQRRPEIPQLYNTEIYGRVPDRAPKVTYEVVETDPKAMDGLAIRKLVVAHIGDQPDGPTVHLHIYLPAKATGPVPLLLHIVFFSNPAIPGATGPTPGNGTIPSALAAAPAAAPAGGTTPAPARPRFTEAGPIADMLARGYGYATFRYTEVQPDAAASKLPGVQALAMAPGQTKLAPDEWGTISAWAWGASRIVDYLVTDPAVDAKRIALIGHSRLGKTVLWAGAQDQRFALIFSSCAGEMGSSLARRDYGETVDDMAANFPWQFAGNLQKYPGHWNDMPVDTHMLIALSAPRPVFISGGTGDQWADPRGEFLAEVAAGPVYRLLGARDLGATEFPPVETPLITGDLGFHYHTGPHTITPSDWKAFLDYSPRLRHFQPGH